MPEVVDATGVTWKVKRRWLPWRLRRRDLSDAGDFATGVDADDDVIGLTLIVIFVLLPIVGVVIILFFELALLLLLIPFLILIRILLRRPWPIEVWKGKRLMEQESVKGWAASSERVHDLINEIRLRHSPGESA